jgi:hypothetical protein
MSYVQNIIDTLWGYVSIGNYFQFYVTMFNTYFPFGILFWLIGILLFIVFNLKSKSLAYGGGVAGCYFVIITEIPNIVTNAYSNFAMKWFGVILALICGYYIYKEIKGNG